MNARQTIRRAPSNAVPSRSQRTHWCPLRGHGAAAPVQPVSRWDHPAQGTPEVHAASVGSPMLQATPPPRSIVAIAAISSASMLNENRSAFWRMRAGVVLLGSTG